MSESLAWAPLQPAIEWSKLNNVYLFGNGKGGVGKTSSSAHFGALPASDGVRTLIIDFNGQGNVAQLFGFANTQQDDQGRNLFSAVTTGARLEPVRDVRPNLDVVPGGPYVMRIGSVLSAEMSNQEAARGALLSLADSLQAIAGRYQLIVIDTPPENPLLLQIALCAARFVIVPMKSDNMSRKGLRDVAREIRAMREHNPHLMLLGVFVFASGTGAKNIRKELREGVAKDLGENSDLVLKAFIRHSEGVAKDVIKFGRLAHELEQEIPNNPKHWELKRGTAKTSTVVSDTSRPVAEDFAKLAKEVLTRAAQKRAELMEEGVWP